MKIESILYRLQKTNKLNNSLNQMRRHFSILMIDRLVLATSNIKLDCYLWIIFPILIKSEAYKENEHRTINAWQQKIITQTSKTFNQKLKSSKMAKNGHISKQISKRTNKRRKRRDMKEMQCARIEINDKKDWSKMRVRETRRIKPFFHWENTYHLAASFPASCLRLQIYKIC